MLAIVRKRDAAIDEVRLLAYLIRRTQSCNQLRLVVGNVSRIFHAAKEGAFWPGPIPVSALGREA